MSVDSNFSNFAYPLHTIDFPEEESTCQKIYNYIYDFFGSIGSIVVSPWRWLVSLCNEGSVDEETSTIAITERDTLHVTTQVFQQTVSPESSISAPQQNESQVTPLTDRQRILQDFVGIAHSGGNPSVLWGTLLEILNFQPDEQLSQEEILAANSDSILTNADFSDQIKNAIVERNEGITLENASAMMQENICSEVVRDAVQSILEAQPGWQINHYIEIVVTRPGQHSIQERFQVFRDMMDITPNTVEVLQENINQALDRAYRALRDNTETSELLRRLQIMWGLHVACNESESEDERVNRGIELFDPHPYRNHCSAPIKAMLSNFILIEFKPPAEAIAYFENVATNLESHTVQERFQAFRDMMDIARNEVANQTNINSGLDRVYVALRDNEETSEMVHRLHIQWGSYGNTNILHTDQGRMNRGIRFFQDEHCSTRIKEKLSRFITREFPAQV